MDEVPGKQHQLRWNRGAILARIKAEEAEIDLDVAVSRLQPALGENAFARARQARIIGGNTGQFQREVCLHSGADLGGSLGVYIEPAVGKLAGQNRFRGLPDQRHAGRIPNAVFGRVHPQLEQNVIGFERAVGGQLRVPVAARVLPGEKVFSRALDGGGNRPNQTVLGLNSGAHRVEIVVKPGDACASSPGSENRTSSSTNSTSSNCRKPCSFKDSIRFSTRCSGAEAPAVTATFLTESSQAGFTSSQSFTRNERTPLLAPTSTSRFELELFSDPTTSSRSQATATAFTAICRFSVA